MNIYDVQHDVNVSKNLGMQAWNSTVRIVLGEVPNKDTSKDKCNIRTLSHIMILSQLSFIALGEQQELVVYLNDCL